MEIKQKKISKVKEQEAVAENNWENLRVIGRHGGVEVIGNARESRGVLISRITWHKIEVIELYGTIPL